MPLFLYVIQNNALCYRIWDCKSLATVELTLNLKKLNLWFTAPKGATPVTWAQATDWQMTVRRDDVISITLRRV